MPLTINSRIDIKESLRRGYPVQPDHAGRITVTIPDDIGEVERKLIADHIYQSASDGVTIATPTIAPALPEPTVAGIIEVIRAAQQREAESRAALTAERMAAIQRAAEIVRMRKTTRHRVPGYVGDVGRDWDEVTPASPGTAYTDDGGAFDPFAGLEPDLRREYDSWCAQLRDENEERKQAARREAKEAAAAHERAAEESRAERATWIGEHGSHRLKRLVDEGIEHEAVYRDERLAHDRPGWQWEPRTIELSAPRNPPEAALDLLDEARKTEPSAELAHYIIRGSACDEDEDEENSDIVAERGYVAQAEFLGRTIVTTERVVL